MRRNWAEVPGKGLVGLQFVRVEYSVIGCELEYDGLRDYSNIDAFVVGVEDMRGFGRIIGESAIDIDGAKWRIVDVTKFENVRICSIARHGKCGSGCAGSVGYKRALWVGCSLPIMVIQG